MFRLGALLREPLVHFVCWEALFLARGGVTQRTVRLWSIQVSSVPWPPITRESMGWLPREATRGARSHLD